MTLLPKLTVIVGPTASGKTRAGIEVARKIDGEIVSADSRQIYSDMNIGTAKPEFENIIEDGAPHDIHVADVVDNVNHYLFNIRRPDDQLTLAKWQESAFEIIDGLIERSIPPILVGGTMLYVDSVALNYAIPDVKVNKKLRQELEKNSAGELFGKLMKKDPEAISFIEPKNKRRIIRALEVIESTGQSFSEQRSKRPPRYDIQMIGVFPGWDKLSKRIKSRVKKMLEGGLVEETMKLQERYGAKLPLLQTINYKQVVAMLAGELSENEIIEKMIQANSRYARRQMSWWKGRKEITWEDQLL